MAITHIFRTKKKSFFPKGDKKKKTRFDVPEKLLFFFQSARAHFSAFYNMIICTRGITSEGTTDSSLFL